MIFDPAKKEAETNTKLSNLKVFSEGDATVSVMDIAKRLLIESLQRYTGEISTFSKNYQPDKLMDPTAKLSILRAEEPRVDQQGIKETSHSFLNEDEYQEGSGRFIVQGDEFKVFCSLLQETE